MCKNKIVQSVSQPVFLLIKYIECLFKYPPINGHFNYFFFLNWEHSYTYFFTFIHISWEKFPELKMVTQRIRILLSKKSMFNLYSIDSVWKGLTIGIISLCYSHGRKWHLTGLHLFTFSNMDFYSSISCKLKSFNIFLLGSLCFSHNLYQCFTYHQCNPQIIEFQILYPKFGS